MDDFLTIRDHSGLPFHVLLSVVWNVGRWKYFCNSSGAMSTNAASNGRICFLLGAGASVAAKLPTMVEMWDDFTKAAPTEGLESLMAELRKQTDPSKKNVEALLTISRETLKKLRPKEDEIPLPEATQPMLQVYSEARQHSILSHETHRYILHAVARIKRSCLTRYSWFTDFADRHPPVDVFSLNYDTVIEDFCAKARVHCADGFDSRGRFQAVLFSQAVTGIRLWKLHGSVTWHPQSDGSIRRVAKPATIRRRLRVRHSASLTKDVALIWPAAYGASLDLLNVLWSSLRAKLSAAHLLIVIGYRFGDPDMQTALVEAWEANPNLRVILLCGDLTQTADIISTLSAISPLAKQRIDASCSGFFPDAMTSPAVQQHIAHALSASPPVARRARTQPEPELVCIGQYRSLASREDHLYLVAGEPYARLYRCDVPTGRVTELSRWRGYPRGFALVDDHALIAECRWLGLGPLGGIGFGLEINIVSGRRRPMAWRSPLILLDLWNIFRTHKLLRPETGPLPDHGFLSWPTSICVQPESEDVWITEARCLVHYNREQRKYRRVTPRSFFNLQMATPWKDGTLLLLEHMSGAEGCLWQYDPKMDNQRLLVGGISKAGGILPMPDGHNILISANSAASSGAIWRFNTVTGKCTEEIKDLKGAGSMTFLNDGRVAVAATHAVVAVTI